MARAGTGRLGLHTLLSCGLALAIPAHADALDHAREDQNPVTRFYVVRVEDNAQMGFGPDNQVMNFLRVQPLVPLRIGADWRLLARAVIPIAHQPWPREADGLGDSGLTLFLTPARAGAFTWGIGPSFLLPTATGEVAGTGRWSAGPAMAGIYSHGPWVVGAVVQNLWSFAGNDANGDVNAMTLRPLVNYNLPGGWYLTSSPAIAANWRRHGGERWLVPVGGGIGRAFTLGTQRVGFTLESYYHVQSPTLGPDWQVRLQFSLLYPE